MASIVAYDGGLRRIEFSLTPNGDRKAVRLGRVSAKVAEVWRAKIEAIIGDKLAGRPHDAELSKWLGGLDETLLGRMRAVGLADGVGLSQTTLAAFLDRFAAALTGKPATLVVYGHVRRNLEDYFAPTRLLRDIRPEDADGWRVWLVEHEKLAVATVARRVIAARTIWRRAIRWKLAGDNPFDGVKTGHQCNDARKVFVPRDVIDRLIADAPDVEWRLILALSRYAGLRCPSEHLALTWNDIDWAQARMTVHSPKTEHHEGGASRLVPIFPEVLPHLRDAFEQAEAGSVYVIARHRQANVNLRTQLERMIHRAGLTPWPRLFHNLRASRETELMREYDLATVCKWIGNSPGVAAKHYATCQDLNADFRRAAGLAVEPATVEKSPKGQAQQKAQQKAQQSAAVDDGQAMTSAGGELADEPENRGNVTCGPSLVTTGKSSKWTVQDSNL